LIKKRNPKLVLTLCNLPAVTRYKQIYLHDNPYVSEESIHYIKLSVGKQLINKIRGYITLSRMKFVDLLIVQTDYQKKKLQKKIRKSIPIKIIPPCIPFNDDISYDEVNTDFFYNNKTFKIFCPARYYEHKNLEVLLKVSNLLIEQKIPAKLYVTISAKHGSKARKLLKKINTPSMNIALENLGHKSRRLMSAFYKKADAVLLPSLLESFSLVCIESWFYKKPLIVSDLETFKSSCENAALYFNPLNASDIFLRIKELIFDRDKQDELIKNGTEKIKQLPDIHNLSKIYSDLIISCCE
jgi:glycosyltransferase involved in cell wall biosynthesis